jgi:hypothetical protein
MMRRPEGAVEKVCVLLLNDIAEVMLDLQKLF